MSSYGELLVSIINNNNNDDNEIYVHYCIKIVITGITDNTVV